LPKRSKEYGEIPRMNLDEENKMRQKQLSERTQAIENAVNMFKTDDDNILRYTYPEPDARDILTRYTIYPDLKMYWVP
jgi:hypothetical protein